MNRLDIPVVVVGPGSQPVEEDNVELDYMRLPSTMETYHPPRLPEPEETAGLDEARALLRDVQQALSQAVPGEMARCFDLAVLDEANLDLVNQVIGEGDVSILIQGERRMHIQESVLAGVWRIHTLDAQDGLLSDVLEVADIPACVRDIAFGGTRPAMRPDLEVLPDAVLNAPALLIELCEKAAAYQPGDAPHVINLTLLPQTPEDLVFIQQTLGAGAITILSRGYGNCRITATETRHVWWVQYYNSTDILILNTLEAIDVPAVACAAAEDLADSAERLQEILESYL